VIGTRRRTVATPEQSSAAGRPSPLHAMIWRWHFYAGLLVMPLILILSVSGAIYLFKPQIDRWEERDYHGLGTAGAVSADQQLAAALKANPGARFHAYRLPESAGDAAMIHLVRADGKGMTDVFVSPQGSVLGSFDPEARIAPTIARFHGSLFLGRVGDWLVELAASWAIVMILTGLYLWWPRGRGLAGVAWPRLNLGGRAAWRDLHAVTGFWVAGLALVMLLTGLPWASVWGDAFRAVRGELGLVQGPQNWKAGSADPHAQHDHASMTGAMSDHAGHEAASVPLAFFVAKAANEKLAPPVVVLPPGALQRFGPPTGAVWTIKSEAQNRTLQRSITFDPASGAILSRTGFADLHPVDRVVNYGIAWHEGQLLGLGNQLVGVATALMLLTLVVSGFVMWRRRKPEGRLGAPPAVPTRVRGIVAIILTLAALLPLLAASLILLWLVERLVLTRFPATRRWLGLAVA
jgi:uncharacterized iron-regulated membrane protein